MAYVRYVAAESVMVGHLASITYEFDVQLTRADRSIEILKSSQRSMAGNKETLFFGRIATWQVTLFPVPAIEADLYREFLDSTANGQVFVFDPYGQSGHNVNPLQVDREDQGYTERRVNITGDPMYSDYLEFSFTVSEHS